MMPGLESARCTVKIKVAPPLRQYGWIVRSETRCHSLPFYSPAERSQFLCLLAAYVGPAVPAGDVDDLAALLCLYHGSDEAAAHRAAHHLDAEFANLLDVTPLEVVDAMVKLFLEEDTAAEGTC